MCTNEWSFAEGYCKIKTARQKKRLQKKDFDKQLIQLHRREKEMYLQKQQLPMVQLEEPYQRGWKRTFILRDDVARCHAAEFYAILLTKINTETYSTNKGFTHKKRRKGKKVQEVRPQQLADFYTWEWNHPKCKLTDAERTHFYQKECWCKRTNMMMLKWVFAESWRYVLQVKPRMITHVKMLDAALEQELQQYRNYIERSMLRPVIHRLVYGKSYNRWRGVENERQKNPLHHKPLYQILEAVSNDDL